MCFYCMFELVQIFSIIPKKKSRRRGEAAKEKKAFLVDHLRLVTHTLQSPYQCRVRFLSKNVWDQRCLSRFHSINNRSTLNRLMKYRQREECCDIFIDYVMKCCYQRNIMFPTPTLVFTCPCSNCCYLPAVVQKLIALKPNGSCVQEIQKRNVALEHLVIEWPIKDRNYR